MPSLPRREEELKKTTLEAMKRAGTRPEIVYAFEKTGRLLTAEGYKLLSRKEQAEWDDAIEEYFAKKALNLL